MGQQEDEDTNNSFARLERQVERLANVLEYQREIADLRKDVANLKKEVAELKGWERMGYLLEKESEVEVANILTTFKMSEKTRGARGARGWKKQRCY